MKQRSPARPVAFLRGSRLLLAALAIAIACLAVHSLTRDWWPARSVRAQGGVGTFTTFDAPGAGTNMFAGTSGTSIDAAGDIVGIYTDNNNLAHGFFRAANGTITTFDAPAAGTSKNRGTFPISIDPGGTAIAGFYQDASAAIHSFVLPVGSLKNSSIVPFDVPGAVGNLDRGTSATSINTAGVITGQYSLGTFTTGSTFWHGFVRAANGTIITFDVPAAGTATHQGTHPISIDAAGDITGYYEDTIGASHGFLRAANGAITAPIDAPGASMSGGSDKTIGSGTVPISIDTAGDIAGFYTDAGGAGHGFFRAANGTITAPIDAPGAVAGTVIIGKGNAVGGTLLFNLNPGGTESIGSYSDASGTIHVLLRAANGTITAPIDAPMAGKIMDQGTIATGINDSGDVTGTYLDSSEVRHGFLFTPSSMSPAATPTFNPPAGTYSSAQMVTLASTTSGASFFYTTDGSTPTNPPAGTTITYSGPINVQASETIKAIAAANGFSNSAVASATYTINLPAPDFQVSVNPTSLTIVAGQSGMATFTVTPTNGFDSQVSFACTALPAEASCKFNPPNVTPNGSSISTALMVTTTAPSALLRLPAPSSFRPLYACALLLCAFTVTSSFAARRRRVLLAFLPLGAVVFLAAYGLISCGGGSHAPANPGTPAGTTTATVSASAGGTNHTVMLTITITQ